MIHEFKFPKRKMDRHQVNVDINSVMDIEDIQKLNRKSYMIRSNKSSSQSDKNRTKMIVDFNTLPHCKERSHIISKYLIKYKPKEYLDMMKTKTPTDVCLKCNSKEIQTLRNGVYQCKNCLNVHEFRTENVRVYEITPKSYIRPNGYQRSMYLGSHISKIQMLVAPDIDPTVYGKIKDYIKANHIKNITANKLRGILKYYKLPKLYKHIPYILSTISKKIKIIKPIPSTGIERLNSMLFTVEKTWELLYGKKKKKSFSGCSYFIRKVLELLEIYDDHLHLIPLTNSKKNLNKLDGIWRSMCEYNRWEFIPTYKFD